jgi:hypothetical protein
VGTLGRAAAWLSRQNCLVVLWHQGLLLTLRRLSSPLVVLAGGLLSDFNSDDSQSLRSSGLSETSTYWPGSSA